MKKMMTMLAVALLPMAAMAQSDDFGTMLSVEGTMKIDKKLSLGAEVEMRTRDDVKTVDRWSATVGASYKLLPWLKAAARYTFLYDNNERISYFDSDDGKVQRGIVNVGDPKKCGQYWGTRHRFDVSLTGSHKIGKVELSLRERWQYTYRPEYTVDERWSYYEQGWDGEEHVYNGKGKNVLRSRLMAEYKTKGFPITPYVSAEAFNAWKLEKMRFLVGADYKINKQNEFSLFYGYQTVHDDSDLEPDRHFVGLAYKVKF